MKTAFIIIDVQNILVETGFETQKLLEKISYLQDQARKQQVEIIYIQHIETPEALTSEDWQLSPLLKRQENEKVFQKQYNSMFKETGLKEYLDQQGIQQLVLCGMQTILCSRNTNSGTSETRHSSKCSMANSSGSSAASSMLRCPSSARSVSGSLRVMANVPKTGL